MIPRSGLGGCGEQGTPHGGVGNGGGHNRAEPVGSADGNGARGAEMASRKQDVCHPVGGRTRQERVSGAIGCLDCPVCGYAR